MKKGVIIYHSNIKDLYKERWIKKSIESMLNQTDSDLYYYEINYGKGHYSVLEEYVDATFLNSRQKFWSINMLNHAQAMNFILDAAFDDGCDIIFNTNLDDYYHPDRVKIQTKAIQNYDLVSSDFCYISENQNDEDEITLLMNIKRYGSTIRENLLANHNVIAHPAVCFNKTFWNSSNKYNVNKIPEEDLELWQRSISNGYKFKIVPEILLYYRIHNNQVTAKNRNK